VFGSAHFDSPVIQQNRNHCETTGNQLTEWTVALSGGSWVVLWDHLVCQPQRIGTKELTYFFFLLLFYTFFLFYFFYFKFFAIF
jgi:hypothetical protein